MQRLRHWLAGLVLLCPGLTYSASVPDITSAGASIYHNGELPSGEALTARLQGGTLIRGRQFSCVRCHKRSALGTSEAGLVVPPLTSERLFSPIVLQRKELYGTRSEGQTTRPAYNRELLARAIREGVDASGRVLHPAMPRYALDDQALNALSQYLENTHETIAPGVTDTNIHFATIITPDVPDEQRTLLHAMQTQFVKEKNANTRYEPNRVKNPPWHKEWHYRHWRRWNLHTWVLDGEPDSWPQQLANYYQQQPVFAVLGGVSYQDWRPIHNFCEQQALPCLFPSLQQVPQEPSVYNLYFSPGIALEARAFARYLKQHPDIRQIHQVIGETPAAHEAAKSLRDALRERPLKITDLPLSDSHLEKPSGTIPLTVYWLSAEELSGLSSTFDETPQTHPAVFSSTLLEMTFDRIPPALQADSIILHPYMAPNDKKRLLRSRVWMNNRALELRRDRIQGDSYFALTLMGDALMHIRSHFNRDYLIERIEHMTENMLEVSLYPHLSLGPGQRFAAKGCYVLPLAQLKDRTTLDDQYWIIP